MLNLRNRSVNVSRVVLLEKLKENLKIHKALYDEAVETYHTRLQLELQENLDLVKGPISQEALFKVKITFNPPQSHESDYVEVIEMLEMSVDENINLDSESFKAYIKNEWSWSAPMFAQLAANKTYIDGKI